MMKIRNLLALVVLVQSCQCRYQELPFVDTAGCAEVECDPEAIYRTYDGSCTNLDIPHAARAGGPYTRFIPATFADGKSEPRRSVRGGSLPKVRQLVTTLLPDRNMPDHLNTINLMQFGQLITEDFGHRKDRKDKNGEIYNCCTEDYQMLPANQLPEDCSPVEVCPNDHFYSQFNVRCISVIKNINNNNDSCWEFPVEKANFVTHIIDAGVKYGQDEKTARELRTFKKGKFRVQYNKDGGVFPPQTNNFKRDCPPDRMPEDEKVCWMSGDDRANQNTEVTLYQVILTRLHNILCDRLSEINPHWSDERLYQEARRIIGAILMHFTYKHYLPIILGEDFVRAKGLLVDNCYDCCINYYSPQYNPSLVQEFASAFRMFHSQIPREMFFVDGEYDTYRIANFDDFMFRSSLLMESGVVDDLLRGLASQPAQGQDVFFSTGVTDRFFKKNKPFGVDLESIDIQRGREFGVATYNEMRHLCGVGRAQHFNDLGDVMTPESILKLANFYKDVDDIDLFVGVVYEEPLPGTLVGPTSQCILGEQFFLFMRGDRFYYENCGLPWSFTREQLDAIYQTTLSWVFCEAGDNVQSIPVNTLLRTSRCNPIVSCRDIPGLDLSAWKEKCQ